MIAYVDGHVHVRQGVVTIVVGVQGIGYDYYYSVKVVYPYLRELTCKVSSPSLPNRAVHWRMLMYLLVLVSAFTRGGLSRHHHLS